MSELPRIIMRGSVVADHGDMYCVSQRAKEVLRISLARLDIFGGRNHGKRSEMLACCVLKN